MTLGRPRAILAFRLLLALAVVAAVTMALLPDPPPLPIDRYGDKMQHMLAFAVLAALSGLAFPKARLIRIGERLSFLGALIEVLQSIPAVHRDCDIRDWIADTLAIAATLLVLALLRRRARNRQPAGSSV